MKHHTSPQKQEQISAPSPKPTPAELAQGAKNGHEVQHWLKAEADLIAERNRTREHGFHNPT